jgi:hypothetical protein
VLRAVSPENDMTRTVHWTLVAAIAAPTFTGCDDTRTEAMEREVGRDKREKKQEPVAPEIPPHPMRDKLMPVLQKIYALNQPPPVSEGPIEEQGDYKYKLIPGVRSEIVVPAGLSTVDLVQAIVVATAEADAWAYRPDARREYADLVHRVGSGYGAEQKALILKSYAHLRLLQFFNGPDAEAAVAKLDGEVKTIVEAMRKEYVEGKQKVWDNWMGVRMYARRVVAGEEPFRGVLREIKKELGKEEPPPRSWDESMTTPDFKAWGEQIRNDEDLLTRLTGYKELREREEFLGDTHSLWVMEGSPQVPAKAKKLRIDPDLGFAALREDLGGGYNDMTYVFDNSLSGATLRKAFLRSIVYGQLLHDFGMLATAGSDFAKRTEDNVIDATTAVVPDKYDPLYAKCGSVAAIDTFINHFGSKFPVLQGLPADPDGEGIQKKAHECVIAGAAGEIHIPAKGDDKDTEGPAPGSRLALYQMLTRFENVDVNLAKMAGDVPTAEDEELDELEKKLQAIREKENAGKGTK